MIEVVGKRAVAPALATGADEILTEQDPLQFASLPAVVDVDVETLTALTALAVFVLTFAALPAALAHDVVTFAALVALTFHLPELTRTWGFWDQRIGTSLLESET